MSLQLGRLVRDNRLVDKVWLSGLAQGLRPEAKETPRNAKNKSGPFSFCEERQMVEVADR